MVVALVGLVFVGAGVLLVRSYAKTRGYVRAPGVIVDRVVSSTYSNDGRRTASAVFEFADGEGRAIRKQSTRASYPWPEIGVDVTVVYDPADPEGTAETLGSRNSSLGIGLALLVAGVAVIVLGLVQ